MRTSLSLRRFLNRRRMAYAWIAGAALWLAWLGSLLAGPGLVDLAGQAMGTDYVQFYTAGYTLRLGESARLYDIDYQSRLQQQIIGPRLMNYHAFITPPFLAWVFVPLAALPYAWSFAVWSALGLAGMGLSLRWLGAEKPGRAFAWALTWFPIFAAVSFGQNSLLSLTLLSLTYWLWRRERLWAAGWVGSLLMYKPQLAAGIGLLWALEWRRSLTALAGLAVGSGFWAAVCFWQLPAASWAYVDFARTVLPDLPNWHSFPLYHLHTIRGFWRLLLPPYPALADGLATLFSLGGAVGFGLFWRQMRRQPAALFAGAICATLWISPHAMIYDWAILLAPAVLLWEALPAQRAEWQWLYALIWLVTFVGGPLTLAQLRWLPGALQISVPVFLYVMCRAYRLAVTPGDAPAASSQDQVEEFSFHAKAQRP